MSNRKTLSVIIPCYNEEQNIGKLIKSWNNQRNKLKRLGINLKIIAIDDCSRDNTLSTIRKLEDHYHYDNVKLLSHKRNEGLGQTINTGIKYIIEEYVGDYMCIMDGDNTHDPVYIYDMLKSIESADCVIASRYRKGSRVDGVPIFRKALSICARIVYTVILGIPNVRDYTCGYRLYNMNIIRKIYEKYGENVVEEKGFACMMELLYKVYEVNGRFEEVPFVLKYDLKCGESKMKVWSTIERSLISALVLGLRG